MGSFLSNRRILVVEDEMLNLLLIEGMLADLGCKSVAAAASADKAIALIDAQDFDVAMIDVNLDGTKSYAVADTLSSRGIPFFFATGYGEDGVKPGYSERPVLQKPFGSEELSEILTRVLGR